MMNPHRVIVSAIVIAAIVAVLLSMFRVAMVKGESMMPTMHDGQFVLATRRLSRLHRGDVVLVRRRPGTLIKRVAYLPGDCVSVLDRELFAGVEDYFDHMQGCLVVPRGRVVVLGDNRPNSEDSRHFGPVAVRDIIGKVIGSPSAP